jgi:hypothetical protein
MIFSVEAADRTLRRPAFRPDLINAPRRQAHALHKARIEAVKMRGGGVTKTEDAGSSLSAAFIDFSLFGFATKKLTHYIH